MVRLLILILLAFPASGQSGKYQINTIQTREAEGTVTINPYTITITTDSTTIYLPVVDTGKDKNSYYYILEGCLKGVTFKGVGLLTESSHQKMGGFTRYYSSLYIELRARQHYAAVKYSIYFDQ